MGDVIDLKERIKKKLAYDGETNFLICACQKDPDEGIGFYPVVLNDAKGILIVALVCPDCEEGVSVQFGRIIE